MPLIIPTNDAAEHYLQTVDLDGRTFGLEFYWNTRAARWFLSLWDASFSIRLLAGRQLSIDVPILARFRDPRLPAGELVATDTAGTKLEAGRDDLGRRVVLLYTTRAELAQLAGA